MMKDNMYYEPQKIAMMNDDVSVEQELVTQEFSAEDELTEAELELVAAGLPLSCKSDT